MRLTLLCCSLFAAPFLQASDDLRWTFESLPPESLVGDASTHSIGPTAEHFVGLPESNVALQLDGNGDYVRIPDNGPHGSLDFTQGEPITMEAWIRLDQISPGQNVYIVGKGRTHKDGPKDNQNYALRIRAVGRDGRISFLFRSAASDDLHSDWHRWTSDRGFRPDGDWHHVAVTYQFGAPASIRGYVDGKSVVGKWDMGGATERPPITDDDELWIGSSMGGSSGNSFKGAIDDVVIRRKISPKNAFENKRIVITHPPSEPKGGLIPERVNVTLHENVGSKGAWTTSLPDPFVRYEQSAFGFSRIPIPFGEGGVRRDWKGPVLLTAMADVHLPDGEGEWMLRAGGMARLWIDDQVVANTPAHLGNSSGHGNVVPYEQQDPWLRPPRAGHSEEYATHHQLDSGLARITLQTMIGGDGLRHEIGEVMVAFRANRADAWQLVSLGEPYTITDGDWQRYVRSLDPIVQSIDDRLRRQASSTEDAYWKERHQRSREYIASLPPLSITNNRSSQTVPGHEIDVLIDRRLEELNAAETVTARTSDAQFLRRLYLDTVGVVPTPQEQKTFQALKGSLRERRQKLVDTVLADPRWADHWTAYWMDVLAENPNVLKPTLNNSGPFRWYLYDMMRDNVPVDRWVTGLIRMNGSLLRGGPAGFSMAAENDVPMAAKAHVATSAFLAANMKCARCHDAPYHDWTQKDLFSIAAMLGRTSIKIPASSSVPQEFFAGEDEGESLITLSLKPGEKVSAEWPLSSYTTDVAPISDEFGGQRDSRDELAYHFTRPENQQFAKTIVNRIWQRLMGEGIVEPIDDWEGADPSHPELLEHLARELAANQFDAKHVARLILNSDAYQRQSIDQPVTRNESARTFGAPRQRRMSAEQLVDSLHAVVGRPMDSDELTFDPEARMNPSAHNNLGLPTRAWQFTSLSNERDRPALSLPRASAITECLEAFGWTGSRQEPINHRQDEANVIQPGMLAGGLLSIQLTRLTDQDELTGLAIRATSPDDLVDQIFVRFLTRPPRDNERARFSKLLRDGFDDRVLKEATLPETPIREPFVSWANHLHPDATDVRLRQSARLRLGPEASRRLNPDWRERFEDAVWALINTPEFIFLP
ncbi:MAG: DUF1553 domain-containing protein [Rubripirellula sp.]